MKTIFNFEGHEVEVINFYGEALFNPRDIAKCLGLSESEVRMKVGKINSIKVIILTNNMVKNAHLTGVRKLNKAGEKFLTIGGLYAVLCKSKEKPVVERFDAWISDEILSRIGKHGVSDNTPEEITENDISTIDEPSSENNDILDHYVKLYNESLDMYNRAYLDRFKNLEIDGVYTINDIWYYLTHKSRFTSMSKEELNNLLMDLRFMVRDIDDKYFVDPEKIIELEYFTLTLKGLIELCYAIDNRSDLYYKVR